MIAWGVRIHQVDRIDEVGGLDVFERVADVIKIEEIADHDLGAERAERRRIEAYMASRQLLASWRRKHPNSCRRSSSRDCSRKLRLTRTDFPTGLVLPNLTRVVRAHQGIGPGRRVSSHTNVKVRRHK